MNRRQFLTGVSAAAVASALPAAPVNPIVGMDLALPGSERTALWLVESTPHGGDYWFRMLYEFNADHYQKEQPFNTVFKCYEESEDRLWQPTFPIVYSKEP